MSNLSLKINNKEYGEKMSTGKFLFVKESPRSELVKVEFNGGHVEAIHDGSDVWVSVKRICENLGIDHSNQYKKIQENPVFAERWSAITTPSTGGPQKAFCLHLDRLTLWLASISPNRVHEDARDSLVKYQIECAEVLTKHFFSKPEPKPMTQAELMLSQAQLIVDQERRTAILEAKTARIEATLQLQAAQREEARQQMRALPAPKREFFEKDLRIQIKNKLNRAYEAQDVLSRSEIWAYFFREILDHLHVNLPLKSKNKTAKEKAAGAKRWKYSAMDIAEEMDILQDVYDLACHLFK